MFSWFTKMASGILKDVSLITLVSTILLLVIGGCVANILYNLYLHPLRDYPGPLLGRATSAYALYLNTRGLQHIKEKEWHDQYGEVVRCMPNYVSYNSSQAWKEIHGYRDSNKGSFDKDRSFFMPNHQGYYNIVASNGQEHRRARRLMAPAFSDKALEAQEHILQKYVDILIRQLRTRSTSESDGIFDMTKWFNFTTFDMVGDLAFGESFGLLEGGVWHRYVSTVFSGTVKVWSYVQLIIKLFPTPLKELILLCCVPRRLIDDGMYQFNLAQEKLRKRMEMETDKKDFSHYMLKGYQDQAGEEGLNFQEMVAQAQILILAGSETTATALSGMTYFLLTRPLSLEKLKNEIRSAFKSERDITIANTGKLVYLQAVFDESLRMYPPVPNSLPRVVPYPGEVICGKYVPGGISVGMHHYASYRSSKNFAEPDSFIPERWITKGRDPKFINDDREAYHPFSNGPRNCLGRSIAWAQLRLVLCSLIYNFDLELQPDSANWIDQFTFLLWEKGPLNVKLTPVVRS